VNHNPDGLPKSRQRHCYPEEDEFERPLVDHLERKGVMQVFDEITIDPRSCADGNGVDHFLNQLESESVCFSQTQPQQRAAADPDQQDQ